MTLMEQGWPHLRDELKSHMPGSPQKATRQSPQSDVLGNKDEGSAISSAEVQSQDHEPWTWPEHKLRWPQLACYLTSASALPGHSPRPLPSSPPQQPEGRVCTWEKGNAAAQRVASNAPQNPRVLGPPYTFQERWTLAHSPSSGG